MDSKPPEPSGDAAEEKPRPKSRPAVVRRPGSHRSDATSAADVGDVLLKFAVVLLSGINAVLWEVYTEAPVMAALWAGIAISFIVWIIREMHNR